MKKLLKAGFIALVAGASVAAASPAFASGPVVPMIHNGPNGPGEAGYFANDNGGTRFRDIQFNTVAVNTIQDLNGTGVQGGLGGELCNDNSGWAAQIGIEWDTAHQPVVEYNYTGSLGPNSPILTADPNQSDRDPCVEGGLLNNGVGIPLTKFTVHENDALHFEIYYNPKGHFGFHQLKFLVKDITQNITEVKTVSVPAQDLYEFGVGVVSRAPMVTGGAINLIDSFTGTAANYYSSHSWIGSILSSHWDLQEADFVNLSHQPTITPNNTLDGSGSSFSVLEGSTSP